MKIKKVLTAKNEIKSFSVVRTLWFLVETLTPYSEVIQVIIIRL